MQSIGALEDVQGLAGQAEPRTTTLYAGLPGIASADRICVTTMTVGCKKRQARDKEVKAAMDHHGRESGPGHESDYRADVRSVDAVELGRGQGSAACLSSHVMMIMINKSCFNRNAFISMLLTAPLCRLD